MYKFVTPHALLLSVNQNSRHFLGIPKGRVKFQKFTGTGKLKFNMGGSRSFQ
jgi:hypothetical protein